MDTVSVLLLLTYVNGGRAMSLYIDYQDERSGSSALLRDRHLHGLILPGQRHPGHCRHGLR